MPAHADIADASVRAELLALLGSMKPLLDTAAEHLVADSGNPLKLTKGDLEQMVAGFLAVLREGVENNGRSVRDGFIETIYPSLVRAGEDPDRLLRLATRFHTLVAAHIARSLSHTSHLAGINWIAAFLGEYTGDIANAVRTAQRG